LSDVDGWRVAGSPVAGHSFATDKRGWHGVLRPQPDGVNQKRGGFQ